MSYDHDCKYPRPSRKYIRNALIAGQNPNAECPQVVCIPNVDFVPTQDVRRVIVEGHRGAVALFARAAYRLRHFVSMVPGLKHMALNIRNRMYNSAMQKTLNAKPKLDLSTILLLRGDVFIDALYRTALGREPDSEGFDSCRRMLASSAPNETLAYMVCSSEEFNLRAEVLNMDVYQSSYRRYFFKQRIKKIPVLKWIWLVLTMPRRIANMELDAIVSRNRLDWNNNKRFMDQNYLIEKTRIELNWLIQAEIERGKAIEEVNKTCLNEMANGIQQLQQLLHEIKENVAGILTFTEGLLDVRELPIQLESLKTTIIALMQQNELSDQRMLALQQHQAEALQLLSVYVEQGKVSNLSGQIEQSTNMLARLATIACEKSDALALLISNIVDKQKTAFSASPGGVTVVQVSDFIIGVPSEEWRYAMFLSLTNHFEPGSEKVFRELLVSGMTVVDVGANLGIYTLLAARTGCKVHSYEPTPSTFAILRQNISANGFDVTDLVNVYNLAVLDRASKVPFTIVEGISGQCHIASMEDTGIIEVEAVSMDDHLAHLSRIDVVKIDAEGSELHVLRGMRNIVSHNPCIRVIIEFAPINLKRLAVQPEELLDEVASMGFDFSLIDEETGSLREVSREELLNAYSVNLLLTRKTAIPQ
jgi:FkbM family methyltransferase